MGGNLLKKSSLNESIFDSDLVITKADKYGQTVLIDESNYTGILVIF